MGLVVEALLTVGPLQLVCVDVNAPCAVARCLSLEYLFELQCERLALRDHALLAVQPGRAWIEVVAANEERATVDRKQPKVAIRVAVEEAFFHCAKAFRRSRLWQPEAIVDRKAMPTLARIILEQTAATPPREDVVAATDKDLEEDYRTQLY
jgi:hypothetical protein